MSLPRLLISLGQAVSIIFNSDTYIKGDLDLGVFVLGMGSKAEYAFNNGHGLVFKQDNSLTFNVVANSKLVLHTCAYDKQAKLEVLDSNGNKVTGATIALSGYSSGKEATISEGVITIPAGNNGSDHTDSSTITITLPESVTETVKLHHYFDSENTAYNNEIYVHAVDVTFPVFQSVTSTYMRL